MKWWLPRWWLYRPVMRLAHRFNWHWMPPCYPDGDTLLVCSWCGARYLARKCTTPSDVIGPATSQPTDFRVAPETSYAAIRDGVRCEHG